MPSLDQAAQYVSAVDGISKLQLLVVALRWEGPWQRAKANRVYLLAQVEREKAEVWL